MAIIRRVEGSNLYEFDLSSSVKAPTTQTAGSLFEKGLEAGNAGRLDEAISYYREALEINPHHAGSHVNLGNSLSGKGASQKAEAIQHYLKALAVQPDNEAAHFNLAVEYASIDEKRKALKHFRLYLRYNRGDDFRWLGYAQREMELLQAQDLQIVAKTAASEPPLADSQTG